jgi:hypothetical protein
MLVCKSAQRDHYFAPATPFFASFLDFAKAVVKSVSRDYAFHKVT